MKKEKIGIIGLGYVGSPVQKWFRDKGHEVFQYDKFKNKGSIKEVNKADIIFIAVPTPFNEKDKGHDISAVEESVKNIEDNKIIIIKSTIVPGSTKKIQETYPKKTILYNPEFLRAKTAEKDYLNPKMQILGYANKKGKEKAPNILEILPKADFSKITTSTEAEVIKYFMNSFLATRVIFAEGIHDLCKALGDADYDVVKGCVIKDKRIGHSHFDILADGYRGYGGACLPKDTKALIERAEELGVDLDLIKKVDEINEKLQRKKPE
ncbi:hypothetical protein CL629_04305 [bacterium]|nr:hypothetical protein [bacterium]|tara:strand:- start:12452 stop:13249 length:798 start_codon:yes stop_codon:yes gene_type:complete